LNEQVKLLDTKGTLLLGAQAARLLAEVKARSNSKTTGRRGSLRFQQHRLLKCLDATKGPVRFFPN